MTCLSLWTNRKSRWYDPLTAALTAHDLPYQVHPANPAGAHEAALAGLEPLGFAGAFIEDAGAQAGLAGLVARKEPEAERAGRVDALRVRWEVPTAGYLFPEAVRQAMRLAGFEGARVLWVGPAVPGLDAALRGMRTVHAYVSSPAEGERMLAELPAPQRGHALLELATASALASEIDVIVYAGGAFPSSVLQPYHGLFALVEPPSQEVYLVAEQVVSPDFFLQVYLSRLLAWVTDVDLPPEAFALG